jgi:hypothetical protein
MIILYFDFRTLYSIVVFILISKISKYLLQTLLRKKPLHIFLNIMKKIEIIFVRKTIFTISDRRNSIKLKKDLIMISWICFQLFFFISKLKFYNDRTMNKQTRNVVSHNLILNLKFKLLFQVRTLWPQPWVAALVTPTKIELHPNERNRELHFRDFR